MLTVRSPAELGVAPLSLSAPVRLLLRTDPSTIPLPFAAAGRGPAPAAAATPLSAGGAPLVWLCWDTEPSPTLGCRQKPAAKPLLRTTSDASMAHEAAALLCSAKRANGAAVVAPVARNTSTTKQLRLQRANGCKNHQALPNT